MKMAVKDVTLKGTATDATIRVEMTREHVRVHDVPLVEENNEIWDALQADDAASREDKEKEE